MWYVLGGDRDYWDHYFFNNWDTDFLHISSEDKRLVLVLPLKSDVPYIVSKGREFHGNRALPALGELPFPLPEIVTPRFVAAVIEWANSGENVGTLKYGDEGFIL